MKHVASYRQDATGTAYTLKGWKCEAVAGHDGKSTLVPDSGASIKCKVNQLTAKQEKTLVDSDPDYALSLVGKFEGEPLYAMLWKD